MAGTGTRGGIVEYFAPGDRITLKVDEAAGLSGGNIVTLTADREVGVAGGADKPLGIAMHDAADNTMISIATEGVWPVKIGAGGCSAGDYIIVDAAGVGLVDNTPALELFVGVALEAIAGNATGPVKLRL